MVAGESALRRVVNGVGLGVLGGVLFAWTPVADAAGYQVVHHFNGTEGANPVGNLIPSGDILYGLTHEGGSAEDGVLFRFNTSTDTFTSMKSIQFDTHSQGSPSLFGDSLYYLTYNGGAYSAGTVQRYNMTTNTITWAHSFQNSPDGAAPLGSLTGTGPILYGTTHLGGGPFVGAFGQGTLFSFNTATQSVSILHRFQGPLIEGAQPFGDLLQSGNLLYGTTHGGGVNETRGTLFKFDTSTNTLTTLHTFTGDASDGQGPAGSVVQLGNFLYGTTTRGGPDDYGTIFEYNTANGDYDVLHTFDGTDGAESWGTPIVVGNVLYGLARAGGVEARGTMYSYDLTTDTLTVLKYFNPTDGVRPLGNLTLVGNTLYGTTFGGGANQGGVIFSYDLPAAVPEPASLVVLAVGGLALLRRSGRRPESGAV
jgi:uncharacterized repeat protein (TIGR03803 family)